MAVTAAEWSTSLQDGLQFVVGDLEAAGFTTGFTNDAINAVMALQCKMLEHLKVPHQQVKAPSAKMRENPIPASDTVGPTRS